MNFNTTDLNSFKINAVHTSEDVIGDKNINTNKANSLAIGARLNSDPF